MRRRSRKALNKGSLEKGHKIESVVGLRRNKYDSRLECKIRWNELKQERKRLKTQIDVSAISEIDG